MNPNHVFEATPDRTMPKAMTVEPDNDEVVKGKVERPHLKYSQA